MRHAAVVLVVLLVTASAASAQELRLAGTLARTNHRLLGDPRGLAVGAAVPWRGALAWRVTANYLAHDQVRTGRACPGLIPPEPACPIESIEDASSVGGVALGLVATVAHRGNVALAVIPGVGVFRARAKSEGRQTGNRLSAASTMIGVAAGIELSVVPQASWPVTLHVGAHSGIMAGTEDAPVDGYAPFYGSIRVSRAEIGLALRIPRAGSR